MRPENEKYVYPDFGSAKTALEAALKEFDKIAEKFSLSSSLVGIAVTYRDEKGELQWLEKAGILGFPIMLEAMHEGMGDLVVALKSGAKGSVKRGNNTGN